MHRRVILYLGTHPPASTPEKEIVHFPVIAIQARPIPKAVLDDLDEYTHLIFTSPNAVAVFCEQIAPMRLVDKALFAVGRTTAGALTNFGLMTIIAKDECQEGVIALLRPLDLGEAYILLPCSSRARGALGDFLRQRGVRHQICSLYDPMVCNRAPLPDLAAIDEIVFTSPSTVEAFLQIFGAVPQGVTLQCRGPVTKEALCNKGFFV